MALGWFPDGYFQEDYWEDDYWQDWGFTEATAKGARNVIAWIRLVLHMVMGGGV